MATEKVRDYFKQFGMEDKIQEFEVSSATVELAAQAIHCKPEEIAKTMAFKKGEHAILIVASGDAKVDNAKFKAQFQMKAKMLTPEEVLDSVGHAVGGVCPFAVPVTVEVYLDISLKRFELIYPAAGSSNSVISLTIEELEKHSGAKEWVDVCKAWKEEEH